MSNNADSKKTALVARKWCNRWIKEDYCSYIWTIPEFYQYRCRCKKPVDSPMYNSTSDKYRWFIQLSAPSNNNAVTITGSVNVMVDNERFCKESLIKCKLSVINASGDETNIHVQSHYQKLTKISSSSNAPFHYVTNFPNFLNLADIQNKDKLLLKDDTLTVFCEVHFIANNDDTPAVFSPIRNGLPEDLKSLLESKEFSDFTVSINEKKYQVHKNILAARSKVFASMLKQEMKEANQNFVEINDIDEKVFEEMLSYMYTGNVPNLDEMASDLLPVADKYYLEHLKTMCEYSLMKKLSVESAVDILILADTFRATLLKQQAIEFIKLHIKSVKKTKTWLKIKRSDLFDEIFDALVS